jgi:hypothetical protein
MVGTAQVRLCPPYEFEFQTANTVIASASEAIQLSCGSEGSWIASSLSLLAMTEEYTFAFPRRESSGFCILTSAPEGAGNTGRAMHPQPCVQK